MSVVEEHKGEIARKVAQAVTRVLIRHQEERRRQRPAPVKLNIKPEIFHGYQSDDAMR